MPSDPGLRSEIVRILASRTLRKSPQLIRLLDWLCEHGASLPARSAEREVAIHALGRRADFDPRVDSIVRKEMGRLRRALAHFYLREDPDSTLRALIPPGEYQPRLVEAAGAVSRPTRPLDGVRLLVLPLEPFGFEDALKHGPLVTEELMAHLGRTWGLTLVGRSVASQLALAHPGDLRLLARHTATRWVVEGSLRPEYHRAASRYRVTLRVVEGESGFSGWVSDAVVDVREPEAGLGKLAASMAGFLSQAPPPPSPEDRVTAGLTRSATA